MRRNRGFTAIDLLVVVGTLAVAVILMLPRLSTRGCKARSATINCLSRLKQTGVAFRLWASDHGDAFPMAVPFEKGGGREFALAGEPAPLFRVLSRELNSPSILYCPHDAERFRTNSFPGMTERNLSYFVGADATELNPHTLLTGDRNVSIDGVPVSRGLAVITNPQAVAWSRALHSQQGNIGLADGSAMQATPATLQSQMERSNLPTHCFVVP